MKLEERMPRSRRRHEDESEERNSLYSSHSSNRRKRHRHASDYDRVSSRSTYVSSRRGHYKDSDSSTHSRRRRQRTRSRSEHTKRRRTRRGHSSHSDSKHFVSKLVFCIFRSKAYDYLNIWKYIFFCIACIISTIIILRAGQLIQIACSRIMRFFERKYQTYFIHWLTAAKYISKIEFFAWTFIKQNWIFLVLDDKKSKYLVEELSCFYIPR